MIAKGRTLVVCLMVLAAGAASLWWAGGPAAEEAKARLDAAAQREKPEPVAIPTAGRPPSFAGKQGARGAASAASATDIFIASFDFEDGIGGPDAQGWTSRDATAAPDTFFHVDDFSGLAPDYTPISGSQSLWCGIRTDTSFCNFATLPGYGNLWEQYFQSVAFSSTGDVSLSYDIRYDVEPGYDFVYVDYLSKTGRWNTVKTYNGEGAASDLAEVPAESLATSATFRFHVTSDGAFSDEDGFFPSDGAVIIDNIVVFDSTGVLDSQDFEGEAVGALVTADGDWFADVFPPFGDYSGLFDGGAVLQEDSLYTNTTHLWGFFNGSTDDYGCGGHAEQAAVPFTNSPGSTDERNYIHNDVYSPTVDLTEDIDGMPVAASPSYVLSFDVYSDLPVDHAVVYDFHVRSWVNGCFTRWKSSSQYYGDLKQWVRPSFELEGSIASGATMIQVAVGVRDMCWYWCPNNVATGTCHSHAPLIDNVTITVPTEPDTLVVTNTNADGPGSLRWAVLLAEGSALHSTIHFDIPGTPPFVIPWRGARFEYPVTVDATTQPGYAGTPLVFLEDDRDTSVGFILYANDCVLRGFSLENTSDSGAPSYRAVRIEGNNAVIESCEFRVAPGADSPTITVSFGSNSLIGGSPETANVIETGYDDPGVYIFPSTSVLNTVRYNSIMTPGGGAGLAIELDPWGINPNDPGDGDFGANYRQNFPVVAGYDETVSQVSGTLNSWPSADYEIDLYANSVCDPSGYGDAELYIGTVSVTTDGSGDAAFTADVAPRQGRPYITGTATDTLGNTSELSLCYLSVNTPAGSGVGVMPLDSAGTSPVTVTFDTVTTEGNTWLEISEDGPEVPGSFLAGDPATYYHLETDAVYSGDIEVCVTYDEESLEVAEHLVRMLHWDTGTEEWEDITTSLDTMTNVVCGTTSELSPFVVGGGSVTGVGDTPPDVPAQAALYQNVPNPFNPTTTIRYDVPAGGVMVDLAIYDVAGRLIKRLAAGYESPGTKTAVWDGRNERGLEVATGVYFYRLRAGAFVSTRKMVLLK